MNTHDLFPLERILNPLIGKKKIGEAILFAEQYPPAVPPLIRFLTLHTKLAL